MLYKNGKVYYFKISYVTFLLSIGNVIKNKQKFQDIITVLLSSENVYKFTM